jgi:ABC-type polysaccharide/polyol phosphate transport system ATPase subunit
MNADKNAIEIRNATVEFRQPHFKADTFKEFVFNFLSGKKGAKYFKAVDSFSAIFPKGSSTALLGHNGSGKSTLLKVVAGILEPREATILTSGRVAPMIELGAGFDGELSGRENIELSCTLMGMSSDEIRARIPSIIEFSELGEFIDTPFKNYSSGMQARLGFACASSVEPDILIVDEVLAVGDSSFQRKCLARIEEMQSKGLTFILVSHDQNMVRRFCTRGILLDHGKTIFDGDIEEAIRIHEKRQFENFISKNRPKSNESLQPSASDSPEVEKVDVQFIQNNCKTEFPDTKHPFSMEVVVWGKAFNRAMEKISIGIGIETENGKRIGGFNNLEKEVFIEKPATNCPVRIEVNFEFDTGIPFLAAGNYSVVVGVHDANLGRTLFIGRVSTVAFSNSLLGPNKDGDLVGLSKSLSSVQVSTEKAEKS